MRKARLALMSREFRLGAATATAATIARSIIAASASATRVATAR
jgi:hypothetical protein